MLNINMATIRSLPGVIDEIHRFIVEENKTHQEVSEELKRRFPCQKGLSCASVKRICAEENIHKTSRLSTSELDTVVRNSVAKVNDVLL